MSNKRHRVAVVYLSAISRDSRVLRQLEYLSREYEVFAVGYGDSLPVTGVKMIAVAEEDEFRNTSFSEKLLWRLKSGRFFALPDRINSRLLLALGRWFSPFFYERWYWSDPTRRAAYRQLLTARPDIIHANKWRALPLAAKAAQKTGAALVLDIPEYAPRENEHDANWLRDHQPMVDYFLRKYGPGARAVITEAQASADAYRAEYGLDAVVILCAPAFDAGQTFRPVAGDRIRLVHHGVAMPNRQLERMIRAVALADDRYTLDFYLLGYQPYIAFLRQTAEELAPGRVNFREPLPPGEIVREIAAYDMGIFILPPLNFQWQVSLPNKFFDFINAGLAVCIGPSLEMTRLTREHGFGAVSESFEPEDMADLLNRLDRSEIEEMKRRALEARKVLNADMEMAKLIEAYKQIVEQA